MDSNRKIASLLRDLASVQQSTQSKWGYKRAASAILGLDEPIEQYLLPNGTLRKIPNIGPSSTRVILEVLQTGRSATVDAAVAESPRAHDVERARGLRENFLSRAQVIAALAETQLGGPRLDEYRGDLQMHSTWSDGGEPIASMAEAAAALGWSRIGMTDHSYGLPIARGMDERRIFEYVVASPHSLLRRDTDQTARMVNAVRQPGVAILGHPQGRMFNSRPGISADWVKVFREAARHAVAVEIDGNWHRQDIHYELAALANEEGCLFALDSDAHSIGELAFTDYSIAHARIAGVPADRVVNCWDEKKFDEWLGERHGRPRTRRPQHETHKGPRTAKR